MSLPLAASIVALAAILTNRVVAVAAGLWLKVPATLLLGMLLFIDVVQIPFFFRLYEQGSSFFEKIPMIKKLLHKDWSKSTLGRWAKPLGGFGVMLVAALPTFGGGMWSATFLAYGLGLRRTASYSWLILGSVLSYGTLYWILDVVVRTIFFFTH